MAHFTATIVFAVIFLGAANSIAESLEIVDGCCSATIHDQTVIRTLIGIPGVVKHGKVYVQDGGLSKVALVNRWLKRHPKAAKRYRPDIDAIYYRQNRPVWNHINDTFMDQFHGLLTDADFTSDLKKRGVRVKVTDFANFSPTTFIVKDPTKNEGILTLTEVSVCTKDNAIVIVPLKKTILDIPACPGGHVYTVFRLARMYFNPLCGRLGHECALARDLKRPVWTQRIGPGVTEQSTAAVENTQSK